MRNMLLFEADHAVGEWVASRIPHIRGSADFGPFRAIGVVNGGAILAGCIYHNWIEQYGHCEVSFAGHGRWATRGIIRALLSVPFDQYGCRRISCITPHKGDVMAIDMLPRLGFTREGVLREFFAPKQHAVVFRLMRDEYRKRWC